MLVTLMQPLWSTLMMVMTAIIGINLTDGHDGDHWNQPYWWPWCDPPPKCFPTRCPAVVAAAPLKRCPMKPEPPPLKKGWTRQHTINGILDCQLSTNDSNMQIILDCKKRPVMFQFYPKFLAITITLKTWKNKSVQDMVL